jgi:hypothetical protein
MDKDDWKKIDDALGKYNEHFRGTSGFSPVGNLYELLGFTYPPESEISIDTLKKACDEFRTKRDKLPTEKKDIIEKLDGFCRRHFRDDVRRKEYDDEYDDELARRGAEKEAADAAEKKRREEKEAADAAEKERREEKEAADAAEKKRREEKEAADAAEKERRNKKEETDDTNNSEADDDWWDDWWKPFDTTKSDGDSEPEPTPTPEPEPESAPKVSAEPLDWIIIAFSGFLFFALLVHNVASILAGGGSVMQTLCYISAFDIVGLCAAAAPFMCIKERKHINLFQVLLGMSSTALCLGVLVLLTEFYRYGFIIKPL